jgi:hypothetical protein
MTSLSYEPALCQDQQCENDEVERFVVKFGPMVLARYSLADQGSPIGSCEGPNFYTTIFAAN